MKTQSILPKCTREKVHSSPPTSGAPGETAAPQRSPNRKPRKSRPLRETKAEREKRKREARKAKAERKKRNRSREQAAAGALHECGVYALPTPRAPLERRWEFLVRVGLQLTDWERAFVRDLARPKWWRGERLKITSHQQAALAGIFVKARRRIVAA